MRWTSLTGITMALALAACGGSGGSQAQVEDSLGRDLSLAPVDSSAELNDLPAETPNAEPDTPPPPPASTSSRRPTQPAPAPAPAPPPAPAPNPPPAPSPPPAAAAPRSLSSGSALTLAVVDSFTTQTHEVGQTVTARVPNDLKDGEGRTVIPAGAIVTLQIAEFVVSENKADSGKIVLKATSVAFGGHDYPMSGTSSSVAYTLKGRGVKAGDAAKVGAGAVAGAVVGKVLSGKKKGAVVGGVIGAAAGAAAAANSYDRDIVVAPGARVVIRLLEEFLVG
ncbi:MAG: hypothetical protein R2909_13350 [Gemmatimonadales bacterium]